MKLLQLAGIFQIAFHYVTGIGIVRHVCQIDFVYLILRQKSKTTHRQILAHHPSILIISVHADKRCRNAAECCRNPSVSNEVVGPLITIADRRNATPLSTSKKRNISGSVINFDFRKFRTRVARRRRRRQVVGGIEAVVSHRNVSEILERVGKEGGIGLQIQVVVILEDLVIESGPNVLGTQVLVVCDTLFVHLAIERFFGQQIGAFEFLERVEPVVREYSLREQQIVRSEVLSRVT
jgi:hypothetical protein